MKHYLFLVLILVPNLLFADPIAEKLSFDIAQQTKSQSSANEEIYKSPNAQTSDKNKMLVITDAKVVPLFEFLGLPDVNDLEPTSAGPAEN